MYDSSLKSLITLVLHQLRPNAQDKMSQSTNASSRTLVGHTTNSNISLKKKKKKKKKKNW